MTLCQTITFLSDDEIQFDFPAANITWKAQRFTDEPYQEWDPEDRVQTQFLDDLRGKPLDK